MKTIKLKFKNGLVWYPIQTAIAIIIATLIIVTPTLSKKGVEIANNYMENNYVIDDKDTSSVYDDDWIRINK